MAPRELDPRPPDRLLTPFGPSKLPICTFKPTVTNFRGLFFKEIQEADALKCVTFTSKCTKILLTIFLYTVHGLFVTSEVYRQRYGGRKHGYSHPPKIFLPVLCKSQEWWCTEVKIQTPKSPVASPLPLADFKGRLGVNGRKGRAGEERVKEGPLVRTSGNPLAPNSGSAP